MHRTKDVVLSLIRHYEMILWYFQNTSVTDINARIYNLKRELEALNTSEVPEPW